jgi:sugar O-acyltransferase (sialic acid O-acetyltransferase NeuD family)
MNESTPLRVAIWGAAGHARVVADALGLLPAYRVAGFIDDVTLGRRGEAFCGSRILGGREVLARLGDDGVRCLALAFGHNEARLRLADELASQGFELPVVVHPSAVVARDAVIGEGSFVGPLAVVNAAARIGRVVIVNSGVIVEHDAVVGDGVHLSPRACLAGGVQVGRASWVGAGAVVKERVAIGAGATVGMGAVVIRPVPDGATVVGCPAEQRWKNAT